MIAAGAARKGPSPTPVPDLKVIAGGGGKNSTLSDDETKALFFQHKRKYEKALEVKKAADAAFKNVCKLAKAELGEGAADDIKTSLSLGTPEGQAALKAEMESKYRVARWMGMPLGATQDLFSTDRRTGEEIAEELGFEHGSAGESRKLPDRYAASSPEGKAYFKGYDRGQEAIFNISEKKGEPLLRPKGDTSRTPEPGVEGEEDPESDGDDDASDEGEDAKPCSSTRAV